MKEHRSDRPTREKILDVLKRYGSRTAHQMAKEFGITAMAVRQHLYELRKDGLVEEQSVAGGRGRPRKFWSLSSAANKIFPDAHQALSLELIAAVRMAFGEEGMDRLISIRGQQQRKGYAKLIPADAPMKQKLSKLAAIRTAEGYMADVIDDDAEDAFLLVENHCPICSAARNCTGICREELALFRDTLGPEAKVERVEHIVDGARRCAYRVKPVE